VCCNLYWFISTRPLHYFLVSVVPAIRKAEAQESLESRNLRPCLTTDCVSNDFKKTKFLYEKAVFEDLKCVATKRVRRREFQGRGMTL
jgi:hypothetical protein